MDPATFELDESATVERRSKLALERGTLPMLQPTEPDSATWLKDNMREGDNYLLDPLP
jgi:hypothetical protein